MEKRLPVWLFVLCLLLGSLFTMAFGWSVMHTAWGNTRFGRLGSASVAIASFPDLLSYSFSEIGADPDAAVRVPRTGADLADFQPFRVMPGIHLDGLVVHVDEDAFARASASGWRVLVGNFTVDGELKPAAIVLSPEFQIVKVWVLNEEGVPGQKPQRVGRKLVHGFTLLKDGSVIFTFDGGVSIQRVDRCGKRLWVVGGHFSHAVNLDEDETSVWTVLEWYPRADFLVADLVNVATVSGEILRRISMTDIIAANPTIDILEVRQEEDNALTSNARRTTEKWAVDPFHLNDVEPLPAALVDRFEGFEAGDLLVSVRSLNLVFVVDPETLKVKWWRSGAWRRQHDADWQPTGEITVFDNRMGREYSRIVSIVPDSLNARVVLDGRAIDFYSRIRGRHQITQAGNLLITSPQQGRAFEVDRNGQIVLEIFNRKPGSREFNFPISEAVWFPSEAFDFEKDLSCAN